ncbi:hypothetical protein I9W82_003498 [Candida metapsilosis]|uniref:Flo11 domain-containing protein n=1 Tax=Candida metapsilosis TaxID=273372 RepID=A0A8H7ZBF4_9ASCO|nr:hypothetical protein I9W82_003498 [Candida metapsilosis]
MFKHGVLVLIALHIFICSHVIAADGDETNSGDDALLLEPGTYFDFTNNALDNTDTDQEQIGSSACPIQAGPYRLEEIPYNFSRITVDNEGSSVLLELETTSETIPTASSSEPQERLVSFSSLAVESTADTTDTIPAELPEYASQDPIEADPSGLDYLASYTSESIITETETDLDIASYTSGSILTETETDLDIARDPVDRGGSTVFPSSSLVSSSSSSTAGGNPWEAVWNWLFHDEIDEGVTPQRHPKMAFSVLDVEPASGSFWKVTFHMKSGYDSAMVFSLLGSDSITIDLRYTNNGLATSLRLYGTDAEYTYSNPFDIQASILIAPSVHGDHFCLPNDLEFTYEVDPVLSMWTDVFYTSSKYFVNPDVSGFDLNAGDASQTISADALSEMEALGQIISNFCWEIPECSESESESVSSSQQERLVASVSEPPFESVESIGIDDIESSPTLHGDTSESSSDYTELNGASDVIMNESAAESTSMSEIGTVTELSTESLNVSETESVTELLTSVDLASTIESETAVSYVNDLTSELQVESVADLTTASAAPSSIVVPEMESETIEVTPEGITELIGEPTTSLGEELLLDSTSLLAAMSEEPLNIVSSNEYAQSELGDASTTTSANSIQSTSSTYAEILNEVTEITSELNALNTDPAVNDLDSPTDYPFDYEGVNGNNAGFYGCSFQSGPYELREVPYSTTTFAAESQVSNDNPAMETSFEASEALSAKTIPMPEQGLSASSTQDVDSIETMIDAGGAVPSYPPATSDTSNQSPTSDEFASYESTSVVDEAVIDYTDIQGLELSDDSLLSETLETPLDTLSLESTSQILISSIISDEDTIDSDQTQGRGVPEGSAVPQAPQPAATISDDSTSETPSPVTANGNAAQSSTTAATSTSTSTTTTSTTSTSTSTTSTTSTSTTSTTTTTAAGNIVGPNIWVWRDEENIDGNSYRYPRMTFQVLSVEPASDSLWSVTFNIRSSYDPVVVYDLLGSDAITVDLEYSTNGSTTSLRLFEPGSSYNFDNPFDIQTSILVAPSVHGDYFCMPDDLVFTYETDPLQSSWTDVFYIRSKYFVNTDLQEFNSNAGDASQGSGTIGDLNELEALGQIISNFCWKIPECFETELGEMSSFSQERLLGSSASESSSDIFGFSSTEFAQESESAQLVSASLDGYSFEYATESASEPSMEAISEYTIVSEAGYSSEFVSEYNVADIGESTSESATESAIVSITELSGELEASSTIGSITESESVSAVEPPALESVSTPESLAESTIEVPSSVDATTMVESTSLLAAMSVMEPSAESDVSMTYPSDTAAVSTELIDETSGLMVVISFDESTSLLEAFSSNEPLVGLGESASYAAESVAVSTTELMSESASGLDAATIAESTSLLAVVSVLEPPGELEVVSTTPSTESTTESTADLASELEMVFISESTSLLAAMSIVELSSESEDVLMSHLTESTADPTAGQIGWLEPVSLSESLAATLMMELSSEFSESTSQPANSLEAVSVIESTSLLAAISTEIEDLSTDQATDQATDETTEPSGLETTSVVEPTSLLAAMASIEPSTEIEEFATSSNEPMSDLEASYAAGLSTELEGASTSNSMESASGYTTELGIVSMIESSSLQGATLTIESSSEFGTISTPESVNESEGTLDSSAAEPSPESQSFSTNGFMPEATNALIESSFDFAFTVDAIAESSATRSAETMDGFIQLGSQSSDPLATTSSESSYTSYVSTEWISAYSLTTDLLFESNTEVLSDTTSSVVFVFSAEPSTATLLVASARSSAPILNDGRIRTTATVADTSSAAESLAIRSTLTSAESLSQISGSQNELSGESLEVAEETTLDANSDYFTRSGEANVGPTASHINSQSISETVSSTNPTGIAHVWDSLVESTGGLMSLEEVETTINTSPVTGSSMSGSLLRIESEETDPPSSPLPTNIESGVSYSSNELASAENGSGLTSRSMRDLSFSVEAVQGGVRSIVSLSSAGPQSSLPSDSNAVMSTTGSSIYSNEGSVYPINVTNTTPRLETSVDPTTEAHLLTQDSSASLHSTDSPKLTTDSSYLVMPSIVFPYLNTSGANEIQTIENTINPQLSHSLLSNGVEVLKSHTNSQGNTETGTAPSIIFQTSAIFTPPTLITLNVGQSRTDGDIATETNANNGETESVSKSTADAPSFSMTIVESVVDTGDPRMSLAGLNGVNSFVSAAKSRLTTSTNAGIHENEDANVKTETNLTEFSPGTSLSPVDDLQSLQQIENGSDKFTDGEAALGNAAAAYETSHSGTLGASSIIEKADPPKEYEPQSHDNNQSATESGQPVDVSNDETQILGDDSPDALENEASTSNPSSPLTRAGPANLEGIGSTSTTIFSTGSPLTIFDYADESSHLAPMLGVLLLLLI